MKKIFVFASMMLVLFTISSCKVDDNPVVPEDDPAGNETVSYSVDGVNYEAGVAAIFNAEVGQELSLTLGVYDAEDAYAVDFGDGNLVAQKVGVNNAGPVKEDGNTGSATVFTGTVAGKGIVTVYGKNDIWYLIALGNAMPASFDQEKLKNVVQMTFSGVNVESVELPAALEKLTSFAFNNSPVKSVDVSKVAQLKSLSVIYAPTYTGEMNLEAIDLQNNTELTDLSIQAQATGVNAKLKEIDLSKNTKLTNIYLPNNSLEKVTLPADFTTKDANDPSVTAKVTIFLQNNQLAAVDGDLDKLPAKSQINISGNKFTLATLPAKPANVSASKYTYAPQPAYEVAEAFTGADVLDLSSQLTATGVAAEPKTTTFSFLAGETELKENEDYKVVEPGKFQFLKSQTEKVHAVMATDAFPKFSSKNAYITTEFTVTVSAEGRTWDFTSWSTETVANLKADAAASIFTGWSDVEKDPAKTDKNGNPNPQEPTETSKDNCFWLQAETAEANGKAIKEFEGLVWNKTYTLNRSLAIAVNYPKALSDYDGGAYLWLGGGSKKVPCFTIPGVKAGQTITMVVESHKLSDARGVELYTGVDSEGLVDTATKIGDSFKPTTKDTHTWTIENDADVIVYNTSGCHIYSIVVK